MNNERDFNFLDGIKLFLTLVLIILACYLITYKPEVTISYEKIPPVEITAESIHAQGNELEIVGLYINIDDINEENPEIYTKSDNKEYVPIREYLE